MCFAHHYQVFPDKKGEKASIYKGFEELPSADDPFVLLMCYLYREFIKS